LKLELHSLKQAANVQAATTVGHTITSHDSKHSTLSLTALCCTALHQHCSDATKPLAHCSGIIGELALLLLLLLQLLPQV
jgi:hypothetical protein